VPLTLSARNRRTVRWAASSFPASGRTQADSDGGSGFELVA